MIFPAWVQAEFRENNPIKTDALLDAVLWIWLRVFWICLEFCLEFQILLTKSLCSYVIRTHIFRIYLMV